MRLLSIVFSFRNEEGNLTELVKRVAKTLENLKTCIKIKKYLEILEN